jgi:hypothetical protein
MYGMESDVWKSELSVFIKNPNMEFIFVFFFNMDVKLMYLNSIFNIIRIRHYPKKFDISNIIRTRKQ